MKAVIRTGGKQYLVSLGQKVKIEKIDIEIGKTIVFDDVLLVSQDDAQDVTIGQPQTGIKVEGKVIEQAKDKKVIIFKYKAKKRYKVKKGHRQFYTLVEIVKIGDKKLETPITKKDTTEKPTQKSTELEEKKISKKEVKTEKPEIKEKDAGFFE